MDLLATIGQQSRSYQVHTATQKASGQNKNIEYLPRRSPPRTRSELVEDIYKFNKKQEGLGCDYKGDVHAIDNKDIYYEILSHLKGDESDALQVCLHKSITREVSESKDVMMITTKAIEGFNKDAELVELPMLLALWHFCTMNAVGTLLP